MTEFIDEKFKTKFFYAIYDCYYEKADIVMKHRKSALDVLPKFVDYYHIDGIIYNCRTVKKCKLDMDVLHKFLEHCMEIDEIIDQYRRELLQFINRGEKFSSVRKSCSDYIDHQIEKQEKYKVLNKILCHDIVSNIISYL